MSKDLAPVVGYLMLPTQDRTRLQLYEHINRSLSAGTLYLEYGVVAILIPLDSAFQGLYSSDIKY